MQFVDLLAQHQALEKELTKAIRTVILRSEFVRGSFVDKFEFEFAEMMNASHCVSCANGTDALYISLKALGVGFGDEVITTAHSWISTSETITQSNATVVFCDTEEQYFCINPLKIESLITEKTRGIVVVHLFGQPADMDAIMVIAKKYNLWVIEDCAQAHLAEYKGKKVGTIGDVGTFSFYPGKNLGAMGDAGCLITNREDIFDFSILFARHGGKNNHIIEGINSRMDGIQAAVLTVKMKKLDEWTNQRIALATYYSDQLSRVENIITPRIRSDIKHVFHLYVIRSKNRDILREKLKNLGIPTVINYPKALPDYQAYDYIENDKSTFENARLHANEILSLPLHPYLTTVDQDQVIASIESI